jgi:hypothetical protein
MSDFIVTVAQRKIAAKATVPGQVELSLVDVKVELSLGIRGPAGDGLSIESLPLAPAN